MLLQINPNRKRGERKLHAEVQIINQKSVNQVKAKQRTFTQRVEKIRVAILMGYEDDGCYYRKLNKRYISKRSKKTMTKSEKPFKENNEVLFLQGLNLRVSISRLFKNQVLLKR